MDGEIREREGREYERKQKENERWRWEDKIEREKQGAPEMEKRGGWKGKIGENKKVEGGL
jgi:hypothetical protein